MSLDARAIGFVKNQETILAVPRDEVIVMLKEKQKRDLQRKKKMVIFLSDF